MRVPEPVLVQSDAHRASRVAVGARQRTELLDIAAHDGVMLGLVTICLVGFVNLLLRDVTPAWALDGWMVIMLLTTLLRVAVCRRWRRDRIASHPTGTSVDTAQAPPHAESAHDVAALCSGLAWSALIVTTSDVEQSALPVALTLTAAILLSSTSYAVSRATQLLFALPIIAAQEVNLMRFAMAHPDAHYGLLPIVWLGLVVVLYSMQRSASRVLRNSLTAHIEQERCAIEQTALLENAPLGIIVVRDMQIVTCNDALLKLFGYRDKADLLGKSLRILMPDREAWERALQQAAMAQEGAVPPRIVRRRHADGSEIDVMLKLAAIKSASGEAEFIGIYDDVQDRLAIEKTYLHAIRMHRLVFERAGEGIAIVNGGIIEQANQALADLVGLSTLQLTDRPLRTIFEDSNEWSEIERHFHRLGNTLKLERKVTHSDGRGIWTNVTGCLVDAPPADTDDGRSSESPADVNGRRSVWILADLTDQKQKEAENWYHANHDGMTGLPNRRFLQDRLDQALAFARRDGRCVAVVELDLDGFKSVNDTYGHRFGDAVLEEVARRLSTVVREFDTVGRWGGDEFVLVLKEIASREVVEDMVKRVIARLSEPIVFMGQHLSVGASLGIALYPDHGEDVEALMLAADLAMYESKGSGGNAWRFALPAALAPRGKYRSATTQSSIADD